MVSPLKIAVSDVLSNANNILDSNGHAPDLVPDDNHFSQSAESSGPSYSDYVSLKSALAVAHQVAKQEQQRSDSLSIEMHQLKITRDTEVAKFQQQLQAHAETIAVLVGEKSNLAASLTKFQTLSREKISEVEELQERLNASRYRVQALERDVISSREATQDVEHAQQSLRIELETAQETLHVKQRLIEELQDNAAELRQQLVVRKMDQTNDQQKLQQAQYELGVAQLRMAQLSDDNDGAVDTIYAEQAGKVTDSASSLQACQLRIEELQNLLESQISEREQSGEQYQAYVQQMTVDNGRLAQQLNDYAEQNAALTAREASLVQHMSELERQMQQQMMRQASIRTTVDVESATDVTSDAATIINTQNDELLHMIDKQEKELLRLREIIAANGEQIARLETQLEQAHEDRPDAKSLLETMHGDKLTASRAVTQNVQLKQQLDELQTAFVQLVSSCFFVIIVGNVYKYINPTQSNDKLELTERLQSEQYLGRENKFNAEQRLEQMTSIKEKLHFKDEEMIRLSHENEERTKEVLELTQQIDRLRHYESKAQTNVIVQKQAIETISRQQRQIDQLQMTGCPHIEQSSGPIDTEQAAACGIPAMITNDIETVTADIKQNTIDEPSTVQHIPTEEAMEKLQERFTRTMTDIADLTEEKNRLEHVCTQLQGETETIGEYISLYQNQRQQLKQRELEKDVQMQAIVHDREEMRQKLVQLNALVERLIQTQQLPPTQSVMTESTKVVSTENAADGMQAILSCPTSTSACESTAVQILNLLGEIQDNNQKNKFYNQALPEVHQCACCYGKLETV